MNSTCSIFRILKGWVAECARTNRTDCLAELNEPGIVKSIADSGVFIGLREDANGKSLRKELTVTTRTGTRDLGLRPAML